MLYTPFGSALNTSVQEQYSNQTVDAQLQTLLKPAVTVSSFEPLPEEYFTKKININSSNYWFKSLKIWNFNAIAS